VVCLGPIFFSTRDVRLSQCSIHHTVSGKKHLVHMRNEPLILYPSGHGDVSGTFKSGSWSVINQESKSSPRPLWTSQKIQKIQNEFERASSFRSRLSKLWVSIRNFCPSAASYLRSGADETN